MPPATAIGPAGLDRDDLDFLMRRARSRARRDGRVDEQRAKDLYQGALVVFLTKAEKWFAQLPRESLLQQRRELLMFSLKGALRNLRRDEERYISPLEREEGEEAMWEGDAPDEGPALDRREQLNVAWNAVAGLNPGQRLVLFGLLRPEELTRQMLEEAKAFTKGGASWVPRSIDETLNLLRVHSGDGVASRDPARWKFVFAQIVRAEGEITWVRTLQLEVPVNTVDQTFKRAKKELQARFFAESAP